MASAVAAEEVVATITLLLEQSAPVVLAVCMAVAVAVAVLPQLLGQRVMEAMGRKALLLSFIPQRGAPPLLLGGAVRATLTGRLD